MYVYLPFGADPRICVGSSFAMMEMLIAVSRLMPRFRLRFDPGGREEPEIAFTLRPRGIRMKLEAGKVDSTRQNQ
jgi:cytochrome P450